MLLWWTMLASAPLRPAPVRIQAEPLISLSSTSSLRPKASPSCPRQLSDTLDGSHHKQIGETHPGPPHLSAHKSARPLRVTGPMGMRVPHGARKLT